MNNDIDQWIGKKWYWKAGRNDTPCQGCVNCGNQSRQQPRVVELLEFVRCTQERIPRGDIQSGNASHHKHANGDTNLSSNQKGLQVLPRKYNFAIVPSRGLVQFFFGHVHNRKKGNLHAFHQTHNGHEQHKDNDRYHGRNTSFPPHGGLSLKERRECHDPGPGQNGARKHHSAPEEEFLSFRAGSFFGGNVRVGNEFAENHLYQIDAMKQSGIFNCQRSEGDQVDHKVIVDKIQHTIGSIDLCSQLSQHDSNQHESDTRGKKD